MTTVLILLALVLIPTVAFTAVRSAGLLRQRRIEAAARRATRDDYGQPFLAGGGR